MSDYEGTRRRDVGGRTNSETGDGRREQGPTVKREEERLKTNSETGD